MKRPVHESQLPPVLGVDQMAQLLGMSVRQVYRSMKRPSWMFPELPRMDASHRWSREQVLATLAAAPAIGNRWRGRP